MTGPDQVGDHNVAVLFEALAAEIGDRDCIVSGDRRLSWADVNDRTGRLAAVLDGAGVGRRDHDAAGDPWVSPHQHVALYLHNGPEYLEGMIGAWKAGSVGININYRYVASELAYVLRDSNAAAVIYHGSFAATLAQVLPDIPSVRLLLQVDDGSGAPLLPGAVDYEAALAAASPRPSAGLSPDDRYILYTGGTTGMPKGVLWRQGDFVATCLGTAGTTDDLVTAAKSRGALRTLPSAPFMHGAAHWNAISALLAGGTVVIPHQPSHFDPADVLGTCEREQVTALQIVGDPFARPLLDEMGRHPYDLSSLRFLLSGGAVLSPATKARLIHAVPHMRILDVLGSSETGRQAVGSASEGFRPSAATVVISDDRRRRLVPGDLEIGWLAQTGRVPLGYLGDAEKTIATFPLIDGVRHAVAGDRVRLTATGEIDFLGRDSVTINTGGEKVFAEEVEQVLTAHPAVADAIVTSRPSDKWGNEIVAVVQRSEAARRPDDDELRAHCRKHIAGYKIPKDFRWVDCVSRSPAGKPDYGWAQAVATQPADSDS